MNVVAGSPYTAFAVDVSFDPCGDTLAPDIEVTHWQRGALLHFQIALLAILLCYEREGCLLDRQLRDAFRIRADARELLPLKVQRLDANASERLCTAQVGRNDDPFATLILLREQPQIRDEEVARILRCLMPVR